MSILQLAWLIAFVSSIIAAVKNGSYHGFPNYGWWAIAYYLMCIIGVIVMIASDAIYTYHVAVRAPSISQLRHIILTVI